MWGKSKVYLSENLVAASNPTMAISSDATVSYAWPSTVGVANFVTVKPSMEGNGSTFRMWKKQMLCLLESQEVAGFVNGRIPPPPEDEEQKTIMWRRTDMLVQGWILGSIGEDALEAVWDKPTAREIWLELESIFEEEEEEEEGADEDFNKYRPIYQAALRGDWNTAENFFPDTNQLSTAVISSNSETTLHIAVMPGRSNNEFVRKLVELMPPEALALRDSAGNTALHAAALVGNTEAARTMVEKIPDLLYISSDVDRLPVHYAAINSQKETLKYLLSVHETLAKDKPLFQGKNGIILLNAIIASEFVGRPPY